MLWAVRGNADGFSFAAITPANQPPELALVHLSIPLG